MRKQSFERQPKRFSYKYIYHFSLLDGVDLYYTQYLPSFVARVTEDVFAQLHIARFILRKF